MRAAPQTRGARMYAALVRIARPLIVVVVALAVVIAAYWIYLPGQQGRLAFTLATGIGTRDLQRRVEVLHGKAADGEPLTDAERAFAGDLYRTLARGARLAVVLRQSAELLDHYLDGGGEDLAVEPRVFVKSRRVQRQMEHLRRRIEADRRAGRPLQAEYVSGDFMMGDPQFYESFAALYHGRLIARPRVDGETLRISWRAELPWQWPSYESLRRRRGSAHVHRFPIPNARSLVLGPRYALKLEDGLGEYLARAGIAAPFMVTAAWDEPQHALHVDESWVVLGFVVALVAHALEEAIVGRRAVLRRRPRWLPSIGGPGFAAAAAVVCVAAAVTAFAALVSGLGSLADLILVAFALTMIANALLVHVAGSLFARQLVPGTVTALLTLPWFALVVVESVIHDRVAPAALLWATPLVAVVLIATVAATKRVAAACVAIRPDA